MNIKFYKVSYGFYAKGNNEFKQEFEQALDTTINTMLPVLIEQSAKKPNDLAKCTSCLSFLTTSSHWFTENQSVIVSATNDITLKDLEDIIWMIDKSGMPTNPSGLKVSKTSEVSIEALTDAVAFWTEK